MKHIVTVDFETATYIGDENDGVYFTVEQGPAGGWYLSTVVDCDTGGFCTEMDTDDGPYDTEAAAWIAGHNAAWEWCMHNDVQWKVYGCRCESCREPFPTTNEESTP